MDETKGRRGTENGPAERSVPRDVGVDSDPSRRPGVPRMHAPRALPNTRYPPERQQSDVTVFLHGRPHKTFPPVFGTAVPPRGVSGLVRKAAYRYPDHYMRHWTMLLFADRVDLWERRLRTVLRVALPGLALAVVAGYVARARR
jgi:hypothetical protein